MKLIRRLTFVTVALLALAWPSGGEAWPFGPKGEDAAQKRANSLQIENPIALFVDLGIASEMPQIAPAPPQNSPPSTDPAN